MRTKWTVGQQIVAGFAVALVMMSVLVAMALNSTRKFMATSYMVEHTHQVLTDLEAVLSHLKDAETGQRGFIITGRESFLDPYNAALSLIDEDLRRLRELTLDNPRQQQRLDQLGPQVKAKLEELHESIQLRRAQGLEAASALVASGQGKRAMDALRESIGRMREEEQRLLGQREQESEADARVLTWTLQVGSLLTLVLVVAAALYISRALRAQIASAIEHVQSSSTELQTAAAQQASGAREQSTATTEVSTTMKELLTTSRQIAGNSQQVSRVAEDTEGAARSGTQTVQRAQETIDSVRHQVDVIVNHMLELGKRSQEIGGILDIINELAEQTNILAINATIESAGAGEHGRRFQVVAEEIRKLADRVGSSTKDVRALIDEIRAAANTTIMATEDGSKAVHASARQFAEVAGNFQRILELTRGNLEVAREIELSTQQQATAVEQVSSALLEVTQTARQTEVSSTQTLQTANQLIHLSRQLNALIESRPAA